MTTNDEIGPCPLCGGEAKVWDQYSEIATCSICAPMSDRSFPFSTWNQLSALASREKRMREALERCRDTFKRYANGHRAKGTPEGEEKARNNDRMFRLCEEAMK